jgi:fructosamine-3-kinase
MWTQIAEQVSKVTNTQFQVDNRRSVGGGSINQSYFISGSGNSYFVKLNQASQVDMFESEALGLQAIQATNTIRVPKPICWGRAEKSSYLVLEWLEFTNGDTQSWQKMGRNLAAMHKSPGGQEFGWKRNNTIGSTPQINNWIENWANFFVECRICYQLKLAKNRGGDFFNTDALVTKIRSLLLDRHPEPSLVHGDLWSGNAAITIEGEPVILDPAVYYGDREVDIAMTELFGGFPAAFYHGYNEIWPLDEGYRQRKQIYNLYHILNHFNLFGGGYEDRAASIIQDILSIK